MLIDENPDIWTPDFRQELVEIMKEAVVLEKNSYAIVCPSSAGLSADEFCTYIDYIADRRLNGVGLEILKPGLENPFPWLAK